MWTMTERETPPRPRGVIPRRNTVAVARRGSVTDDVRTLLGRAPFVEPRHSKRKTLLPAPFAFPPFPLPPSGERAMGGSCPRAPVDHDPRPRPDVSPPSPARPPRPPRRRRRRRRRRRTRAPRPFTPQPGSTPWTSPSPTTTRRPVRRRRRPRFVSTLTRAISTTTVTHRAVTHRASGPQTRSSPTQERPRRRRTTHAQKTQLCKRVTGEEGGAATRRSGSRGGARGAPTMRPLRRPRHRGIPRMRSRQRR